MVIRLIPWLVLPLALAACATPRESCLSDALAGQREIAREIARTETVLARGYRIVRTRRSELALTTCVGRNSDGREFGYPCQRPYVTTDATPIGIDYDEERARLARLRAQFAASQSAAETRARQCAALYPAES